MNDLIRGMQVVEASAFIAAPYAGLALAQMGADVIRIDPIGGGLDIRRWPVTESGTSLYWAGLNKGKRSIMLNVRDPRGAEIARQLMTRPGADAGLVITNLPARGWLDYAALKALRDDVIMVQVSGSRDGRVALDYTVNAAAGFPAVTGPGWHDAPVNHVMPVWDVLAGLTIVQGLLAAERHRRASGAGQKLDIALADIAFSTLSHLGILAEAELNALERPRTGNDIYGSYGRDFETRDGRRVMVTAVTTRHWRALLEATGTTAAMARLAAELGMDFDREEDRYAERDTISAILGPWFAARTLADIRAALDAVGACWGPYQTFTEALREDPRIHSSPLFTPIDQPGAGRHLAAGSVLESSALPRRAPLPAPQLGQHTDEILAEALGLAAAEIGRLHDAGVVAAAPVQSAEVQ